MPRVRLEETKDWQLADRSHDVRGRELRDSVGRALGTIQTMIVDTDARRVESVVLEDGNEYPVRDLQIMEQAVYFIPTGEAAPPADAAPAPPAAYESEDAIPTPEPATPQVGEVPASDSFAHVAHDMPVPSDFATESTASVAEPDGFPPVTAAHEPEAAGTEWTADVPAEAPRPPAERFTWHPATPPAEPEPEPEPGSTWESTAAAGDWALPSADTTPAPPPMEAVPETPEVPPSPYAPLPTYAAPAYDAPPPPPPYVAPAPAEEPALEAQREGYVEGVTPEETPSTVEMPPYAAPASESYFGSAPAAGPDESPPNAFAAPALTYAEPTGAGDYVSDVPETTEEQLGEEHEEPAAEVAPGPPDLPQEPAPYAGFTSAGLAAGGLAAGGFSTPPAAPLEAEPTIDHAGPAYAEPTRDYAAPTSDYAEPDVRPAEPFVAGGAPVVAPAEPGHAPGAYAGVAPEPGFPTHASPAEAAVGHTLSDAPAATPPPMPPPEADDYRVHFDEAFAGTGASYDDVADAYSFGAEAAADPQLRWADDDALRRRFNERYGYPEEDRMAWLGARRAVRHGLERGRG